MKPREAAYLSLLSSLKEEGFISDFLDKWNVESHPSSLDYSFALEIASGSARMALALDYIAAQMTNKKKLSLKLKEKALLRTAIYQYVFMQKVPLYAIVDESMQIAKKYCHQTFCSFLNAVLRQLETNQPTLPQGNSIHDLSIRVSYPESYIASLFNDYGENEAINVLHAGNIRPKTTVRLRIKGEIHPALEPLKDTQYPIAILKEREAIQHIAASKEYYIQNATPIALFYSLRDHLKQQPRKILDLCASPGGKLLLAHDLFPDAQLYANDISEEKLKKIRENLSKYDAVAHLSCGLGEEFKSNEKFDLIILDVPCSNTGVLNRRPEARWRLSPEHMKAIVEEQKKILKHSVDLLSPQGAIFYLTCSILKDENERLIDEIEKSSSIKAIYKKTILPNQEGWDGGFGCVLTRSV